MSTCERCWRLGGSTAEGYAAELLKHHDSQHDLLARAEKAEASIAAAEEKLADERKQLTAALEDERRHADALAHELAMLATSAKHNHDGGKKDCAKCAAAAPLAAHAARRQEEAR